MASTLKLDPMRAALLKTVANVKQLCGTVNTLSAQLGLGLKVRVEDFTECADAALSAPDDREELLEGLAEAVTMLEQTAYAEHHCQCPLEVEGPIGSEGCSCVDEIAPLRAILAKYQA